MAIEDHVVDPEALSRGGYATAFLSRDPQRGLPAVERAIRIAPNHAGSRIDAGWVNLYCGRHEQAKSDFHHFIRLSPRDPMLYRAHAGLAFGTLLTGDFEAAANWAKRALAGNTRFTPAHRVRRQEHDMRFHGGLIGGKRRVDAFVDRARAFLLRGRPARDLLGLRQRGAGGERQSDRADQSQHGFPLGCPCHAA